jgi:DNA-binding transcriptional LysR family regulator
MVDRLTSMSVFVRAVELGGFAAAAKEANISATMVAKHVRALESRLGSRLLNRTTRRQSLTEPGRLYYERCKAVLTEVDALESSVDALRNAPRGTLRIASPVSFGARRLAPALAEFAHRHPEVNVDLSLNDHVVDLVEGRFEAAIRIGWLKDSQLIARALHPYASLLCASPEYLRRHGKPKSPQDLAAHQCLVFTHAGPRGRWRFIRDKHEQIVTFTPSIRVDNGEALRQAALAGAGIIVQPQVLLGDDVREGRLIHLLPQWSLPERPMQLVYLRDRQTTPKLKCFVDFIVEKFAATDRR